MNIQVLQNKFIDKKKWDETLKSSPKALIYANSWYLDIVCPLWQGVVLDDYRAIMPIPYTKKFGIPFFLQPPFTQKLGVFSKRKLSSNELQGMTSALHRYFFVQKDIQWFHPIEFNKRSVTETIRTNITLDLSKPYTEIRKNYNSNTIRNIKNAVSANIIIKENTSEHKIIDIFKKTKKHHLPFQLLQKIIDYSKKDEHVFILSAFNQEHEYLAGIIVLKFKNRMYYIFSSTAEKARNTGAPHLLVDYFIQKHCEKKCIFDFEGSDDRNLANFYRGFGGIDEQYYRYKSRLIF